ncbi:MAG: hypothetical protein GF317_22185 [Candidatus Lokiarchaeota archaeon]|nr:hypothetical protein [Candidatus Lokiarchaeota archaeon]MBD3202170.1 hypothetical protein [Candidatus Lokiarchaeota archaeon]
MEIFIIGLLILIVLLLVILILNKFYASFFEKLQVKLRRRKKEKDMSGAVDKFIDDHKKEEVKSQLSELSEIIAEAELEIERSVKAKVKKAKSQYKPREKEIIKRGSAVYSSYSSELRSAMPESEEELKMDMQDLEETMSMLETLDQASERASAKSAGLGLGMFYDKMSRRFQKIIEKNNLNDYNFIPIQRLKFHALEEIKNIKDSDFIPILNVMEETKLLEDIIEINPAFHVVVFSDQLYKFTNTENVVLTFAYDYENLSKKKLMELTEWKDDYTEKILKGLIEKKAIEKENGGVIIPSFGTLEDREKWNDKIEAQKEKEKTKEEVRFQRNLARREKFKKVMAKSSLDTKPKAEKEEDVDEDNKEPASIKFKQKPSPKTLPQKEHSKNATPVDENEKSRKIQDIKDKDSLVGAMEALDKELGDSDKIKVKKKTEKELQVSLDLDDDLEEEEAGLEDLIPEKILNYHEKFSMITGGFSQYEKIKEFLIHEIGEVPDDLTKTMLDQLIELQMIQKTLQIGDYNFFLFKDISFSDEEKDFIQFSINKKPMQKEELIKAINWDEEKVLKVMKGLQERGILRLENNRVIIPGIVQ